jgi:hypothetical protein
VVLDNQPENRAGAWARATFPPLIQESATDLDDGALPRLVELERVADQVLQ